MHKKKMNTHKISGIIFFAICVTLPIIHFCVFWLGTNTNSFLLAFQNKGEFTLDWFQMSFEAIFKRGGAMEEGSLAEGLKNTLTIFGVSNIFIFPLSVIFSYFLYKKIALHKFYRVVFFLPSIISAVVFVTLFMNILNGPVSLLLKNILNMESEPLLLTSKKYAFGSVLSYIIWTGLAGNMVIYCGTMSRVPQEVLESGRLDGLNFFGELFHIVIPLIWPTMSVILLLAVVGIFNADGPILLMTQGRFGTMTIGYWIYNQTMIGTAGSLNYGAAVGLTFTLFSIPLSLLCRWIINRIDASVEY